VQVHISTNNYVGSRNTKMISFTPPFTYAARKTVEDVVRIWGKEHGAQSGPADDKDDAASYLAEEGIEYMHATHREPAALGVPLQGEYFNQSADNLLPPGRKMYPSDKDNGSARENGTRRGEPEYGWGTVFAAF
jgi:hypothetical protein